MLKIKISYMLIVMIILSIITCGCSDNGASMVVLGDENYKVCIENQKLDYTEITSVQSEAIVDAVISYNLSGIAHDILTVNEYNNFAKINALRKIEVDGCIYYYNIYNIQNNDIIIVYKLVDGSLKYDDSFLCEKLYLYDELGEETVDFSAIEYNTPTLMDLRMIVDDHIIYDIGGYDINDTKKVYSAFKYFTDKGIACICYDIHNKFLSKFLIDDDKYWEIYNMYTKYDSNTIS